MDLINYKLLEDESWKLLFIIIMDNNDHSKLTIIQNNSHTNNLHYNGSNKLQAIGRWVFENSNEIIQNYCPHNIIVVIIITI